jgi:NAD(P)-dependent dehydrogenase (short-subunit alcohol dehydrogenase family)
MKIEEQNMDSKVCLVTGATAGIGQATALLLAQQGATVVGIGRNPAKNEFSSQMIKKKTGNWAVEYLQADLSSQKAIRSLPSNSWRNMIAWMSWLTTLELPLGSGWKVWMGSR